MNAPALEEALMAARLCAIDPGLGGMILRGWAGRRDAIVAALAEALGPEAPVRRVPISIDDERLLGGLDLTATLAAGRPITRTGILAEAHGGALVLPMGERIDDSVGARIAAVMDTGELLTERDGATLRRPARFVLMVHDEGVEPDERPPVALAERTAFWIDCDRPDPPGQNDETPVDDAEALNTLAGLSLALGIDSARAPLLALRAARARAADAVRETLTRGDLAFAAAMVLGPRATRLPAPAAEPDAPEPPPPPDSDPGESEEQSSELTPPEDVVLEAAMATLPRDVLAAIAAGPTRHRAQSHGKGERNRNARRGRPRGTLAALPGGGRRLSVIDTLRAAAPWQRLRGRDGPIRIRRDDLRVRRLESRAEVLTVFAVDASGSSALARLAEAKGAVERLLAEAYVKRAHVALVAFRGTGAEVLLPPTRSLTRARRQLGDLPGGGGTPLAAGLTSALDLALAAQARGRTPFIVVLTDGRANIAADGRAVRGAAQEDAMAAARAIALSGVGAALIDISPRPRPEGATIAAAMRARYLPLPQAGSAAMDAAIRQVAPQ